MVQLSSAPWQQLEFFRGLPAKTVADAVSESKCLETQTKQMIFRQGEAADHFAFVIKGLFRLSRGDQHGRRVVLDLVGPGGLFGGLLMSQPGSRYPISVQSVGAGKLLLVSRQQFLDHWSQNGELMRRVQVANIERVNALQGLRQAQRLPMEEKIAWAILQVFSRHDQANELLIDFSRADIADMVGVAPESVIRTFSKWQEWGIITNSKMDEVLGLAQLKERYFPDGISIY